MKLLLLVLSLVYAYGGNTNCGCDGGDYWCTSDDTMRRQFNCSGTPAGKAAWKQISSSDPTDPHHLPKCDMMSACVAQPAPAKNATCDDSCFDFCWKRDVGDCADMDDEQGFCVSQCMQYCTNEKCNGSIQWTPCQKACAKKSMEVPTNKINFVDYSLCMAKCTPVPVSPWGSNTVKTNKLVVPLATEYCLHTEDTPNHKCYDGCASATFKNKGLSAAGKCPANYGVIETSKVVEQCNDGVTNLRWCAAGNKVNVTMDVKGEGDRQVTAMAAPTTGYVHQIETTPGDHCLEINYPGGNTSAFWKSDGWKYGPPVRPEWKQGACDRTKWKTVDATTPNYDGWTSAKNAPNGAVTFNKYGYSMEREVTTMAADGTSVYCMNDPTKKPPYYCHCPPLPTSCKTTKDCVTPWYNSWCMNDSSKKPPYSCKLELPPKCTTNKDCQRP